MICSSCHGKSGEGKDYEDYKTGVPAPGNYDFVRVASDEMIRFTILHGRGDRQMASWLPLYSGLKEAEIDSIVRRIDSKYDSPYRFGMMARICKTAIDELKAEGAKVGLFRPITLYPYPEKALFEVAGQKKIEALMSVELSTGQMIEDVRRIVGREKPIHFFGRTGGVVPSPDEVKENILKVLDERKGRKR